MLAKAKGSLSHWLGKQVYPLPLPLPLHLHTDQGEAFAWGGKEVSGHFEDVLIF